MAVNEGTFPFRTRGVTIIGDVTTGQTARVTDGLGIDFTLVGAHIAKRGHRAELVVNARSLITDPDHRRIQIVSAELDHLTVGSADRDGIWFRSVITGFKTWHKDFYTADENDQMTLDVLDGAHEAPHNPGICDAIGCTHKGLHLSGVRQWPPNLWTGHLRVDIHYTPTRRYGLLNLDTQHVAEAGYRIPTSVPSGQMIVSTVGHDGLWRAL